MGGARLDPSYMAKEARRARGRPLPPPEPPPPDGRTLRSGALEKLDCMLGAFFLTRRGLDLPPSKDSKPEALEFEENRPPNSKSPADDLKGLLWELKGSKPSLVMKPSLSIMVGALLGTLGLFSNAFQPSLANSFCRELVSSDCCW